MNPYRKYQKVQIETSDQGKLLMMLYDGTLKYLRFAMAAIKKGDHEKANHNLLRAQDILLELMSSLNLGTGQIAANLFELYEFMYHLLIKANLQKDGEIVFQVEKMLLELKETWTKIMIPASPA
jgi:flagellar protein FliS